jgi:16S rRNA (adenine1518-N6/adenine1519-N6)-dimethyltransferase
MKPPSPVKSRGQHFLKDERVVRKIVGLLVLADADTIVEIGPGRGALTGALLETGKRVVAVEPDGRMIQFLTKRFGAKLTLVHDSVLNVKANDTLPARSGRALLVGNLPYNLSGPMLGWIFASAARWRQVVVMLQLEVARRLVAKPATRDFGPLAVACALDFSATKKFLVRPGAFFPVPEVTSAVVELEPSPDPPIRVDDRESFLRFVHALFAHRRKNVRNNLLATGGLARRWEQALAVARVDGRLRAEQLRWQDLASLYRASSPLPGDFSHGR